MKTMRTEGDVPDDRWHTAMRELLHAAADRDASDVHLVPGYPAAYRVHGRLEPVNNEALEPDQVRRLVESVLPEAVLARLHDSKSIDCSVALTHRDQPCRFRANLFWAQGSLCACFRHVPNDIPSFDWMNFPGGLAERLVNHAHGLVIVTGVTGSGKTTTLAALVNLLNQRGDCRIITVEEPIEYVHPRISSTIITQREVGRDVDSFFDGLRSGLRQDPNVILIGEIRDRDTAAMALTAAETGHLILSTMHTKDAKGAVTRCVDLFPHDAQDDIRTQLSLSLRSVVCQHLLPSATEGEKRVLALEVMHVNHPVRSGIRFGKIDSIESAIQTGKRDGMLPLDESLQQLVDVGRITLDTARRFAKEPDALRPPSRGR
ncbi:MAG TPA: PilT/PilU family type 4a pilus ATPase [Phycisphaerae bacterium]|nr:PilT/PilU family type 4a pilus ATPase [Phycisphaerae bacterium]HNU44058.1 PilT/PilU family type 4a pilus ATPase [Phycisphaerae bacterium]